MAIAIKERNISKFRLFIILILRIFIINLTKYLIVIIFKYHIKIIFCKIQYFNDQIRD